MKLVLALAASTLFAPLALPDTEVCAREGALACVELAPEDGAVRLASRAPATYVVEDAQGRALAAGPVTGALVALPEGAARLVVRAA